MTARSDSFWVDANKDLHVYTHGLAEIDKKQK